MTTVRLLQLPAALHVELSAHHDELLREFRLLSDVADPGSVPARLITLFEDLRRRLDLSTDEQNDQIEQAALARIEAIELTYEMPADAGPVALQVDAVLDEVEEYCQRGELMTLASPPKLTAYRRWLLGEIAAQVAGAPPTPWPESPLAQGAEHGELLVATRQANERLEGLQKATAALAAETTLEAIGAALFDHALPEMGAASGALWLLDEADESLRFAGGGGLEATIPKAFGRLPLSSGLPAITVVVEDRPIVFGSRAERDERWPELAGTPSRVEAVATLPVRARGRTLGCLSIGFTERRSFDEDDLTFLGGLADQAGLAVDRARLFEAEREARDLLSFLADASRMLSESSEPSEILRRLCDLAVPRLADWSSAYVPEGTWLGRTAMVVDGVEETGAFIGRAPVAQDSSGPVATAFRTGEIAVAANVTADAVAATRADPEWVALVQRLALRAAVAVPLKWRGAVVAVVTFAFRGDDRTYGPRLLETVGDLCARAGVAYGNALRLQREQRVATTLTQAVLPADLLTVPGVDVAARYRPVAAEAGDVGGDWFDTWPLPDGRLLVSVGDVSGHGLVAASRMAQFRHAARAWALDELSPGQVLGRLNRLAALDPDEAFATAVFAVVDPGTGAVVWASAGHPPPVLSRDHGRALDHLGDPPLGVDPAHHFVESEVVLDSGELFVLYTDGVVERPTAAVDIGIGHLASVIGSAPADCDLAALTDRALAGVHPGLLPTDDACVLILRRG